MGGSHFADILQIAIKDDLLRRRIAAARQRILLAVGSPVAGGVVRHYHHDYEHQYKSRYGAYAAAVVVMVMSMVVPVMMIVMVVVMMMGRG